MKEFHSPMSKGATMKQRFVSEKVAKDMVKPRNHAILEAGHKLTVKPGTLIQRVDSTVAGKPARRYQVTEG
jgi:hypothetical protein